MKPTKKKGRTTKAPEKKFDKRFIIWGVVCAVVFAALAVAVNVMIPAKNPKQVFDSLELPSLLVGPEEDRKVTEGQSGVLTYGPYVTLQAGDYEVRVHYKTNSERNTISSYSLPEGTFLELTNLPANKSVYKFDLSLEEETPNVEVNVTYAGEGSLEVEYIEFIEQRQDLRTAQWVLNVLLVIFFATLMVLDYFWEKIAWKKMMPHWNHNRKKRLIKSDVIQRKPEPAKTEELMIGQADRANADKIQPVKTVILRISVCATILVALALIVNLGIPALNQRQEFDDLDFYSRLIDMGKPRKVNGGKGGCLTFGPYAKLAPGQYKLRLYYSTDTDTNYMDVVSAEGTHYKGSLQTDKTVHEVNLSLDKDISLDCRTWYSGEGYLAVDHMELMTVRRDLRMTQYALNILLLLVLSGLGGYYFSKIERRKPSSEMQIAEDDKRLLWKTKAKKSIPVALFVSFTFFIAGPIGLYLSNVNEFWFSIWQMIPVLLVAFSVATILFSGLLAILPRKVFLWAVALVFGFGIGLYVEGNFLVQDYGVLNGSEIAWSTFAKWAVIDTLIWAVIFLIVLILVHFSHRIASKVFSYGSSLLTLIQAVALIITGITTPGLLGKTDYLLTTKNMMTVSDTENIIVFLLDAFDASYMTDFLETYPEYRENFVNFTFYPNTSTYGALTRMAVPHILTGVVYREEVSYSDYLKLAAQYAPIYQDLVDNNYEIGIYTSTNLISWISKDKQRQSYISNVYEGISNINNQGEFLWDWVKLTAFRYLPHILKEPFEMYGGVFNGLKAGDDGCESYIHDSAKPYSQLQEPLQFETEKNAFRFYHLMGTHEGFNFLNEYAEEVDDNTKYTKVNDQHIKGCLYVIDSYIQQLCDAGVYDNSTIIIMADHGQLEPPGNALLMIKPKNYTGEFRISNAPISYTDLLPTFLEILGEDGSAYGRSINEIDEEEQRTRSFYRDMLVADSPIMEYRSDGAAGDPDSWVQIGPALDQLPIEVEPVGVFEESSQIYTVLLSNEATRHYQLTERPGDDLQVDLTLYSLTDQASHMVAYADGVEVFNGSVSPNGNASFALPEGVFADDVVELRFEFPEENESAAHLIALNFAKEQ